MKNIKLTLAYDGTNYLGWQKSIHGKSIESTLQNVLEKIFQRPLQLQAASRTDARVHADGQVVNFFIPEDAPFVPSKLHMGLNRLLPKDITVLSVEKALENFHPTLDAKGKEYRYYACHGKFQLPHNRHYSWHYHYPLDFSLMEQAAKILTGKHNFSSFCNQRQSCSYEDFTREVYKIGICEIEQYRLYIAIKGDNFLYRMARNMAAMVLAIGARKIDVKFLEGIIGANDRAKASVTAPPHALFLHKIYY